ncbi:nucleotidyltransferase domain-containing protein [Thermodesulfovibrio hydrogeniphilus]
MYNFGIPTELVEKIKKIVFSNPKVLKMYIYGSRAKGNYKKGSDIDIAIVAPELDFSEYLKILDQIEEINTIYSIDLTHYELLDDAVKEHIKRVGTEIIHE